MTLYKRREKFEGLSERMGKFFAGFGLSPNKWTLISILPALLTAYYLYLNEFLFAVAALFFTILLDVVDGSVARHTKKTTNLGAYMDTITDRYVEFIVIVGLLFADIQGLFLPMGFWILLFLFGSFMTTYAKAAASEKKLVHKEMKGGILERTDRMVVLLIGLLAGILNPLYLGYVVVLLAILTNISALQRIYIAAKSKQ